MGRAFALYGLPQSGAHQHVTSTGTGDFKSISPPPDATAALMTVSGATNVRMKFDGVNPTAGSDGLLFVAGGAAILLPFKANILFCSETAANSTVDLLYLA